jgi:hypothetical protein
VRHAVHSSAKIVELNPLKTWINPRRCRIEKSEQEMNSSLHPSPFLSQGSDEGLGAFSHVSSASASLPPPNFQQRRSKNFQSTTWMTNIGP